MLSGAVCSSLCEVLWDLPGELVCPEHLREELKLWREGWLSQNLCTFLLGGLRGGTSVLWALCHS